MPISVAVDTCLEGRIERFQDEEVKSASHETHGLRLGQVWLPKENQQKREWLLGRVLTAGELFVLSQSHGFEVNCCAREHTG